MQDLIIVESPTKAKTLSRFLGSSYRVEATMGHVRDLPEKKLGIEIKVKSSTKHFSFIPDYQAIIARKGKIAELRKVASTSNRIILATDPDREGEAIAWHIAHLLKSEIGSTRADKEIKSEKLERIVFHEITESAIKHALENPAQIDIKLVDAQQARRILDRLVGYKLSPLLWNKLGKRWLSAGRVQSVAVRLIVDREREIQAFKPVEYWLIDARLAKTDDQNVILAIRQLTERPESQRDAGRSHHDSFIARLTQQDGKKIEISQKDIADKIVSELNTATYTVSSVDTKEVRRNPAPPFTTSTLQQKAATQFGWSAKRTMRTAQLLYEEGYITYHRTDSTNLSTESVDMVRVFIKSLYGQEYLPKSAKFYKTKSKVAQEAHEAIRPTNMQVIGYYDFRKIGREVAETKKLKILDVKLGRDAELIYSLIWKRFLACQINEAIFDATAVDVTANQYTLHATGQRMKFAGWLIAYGEVESQKLKVESTKDEDSKDQDQEKPNENKELPQLSVGESLDLKELLPQQKFTEPLPRYNDASLIKTLEEKGIGRPSTYAPIISTIEGRKYVEKIEKKFHPTDLGFAVTDFLVKHFPEIFAISFTAKMENDLDEIANGNLQWENVVSEFYGPLATTIAKVYKIAERVKIDLGTTDEKCPTCGKPLVIRMSKFGKFLACSTYPTCKFTKNIIEKIGIQCPKCKGDIIVKHTRFRKKFYGCSNYPTCTFAAWKKEQIK